MLSGEESARLIAAVDDSHRMVFEFLDVGTVHLSHELHHRGECVPLETTRSRRTIERRAGTWKRSAPAWPP